MLMNRCRPGRFDPKHNSLNRNEGDDKVVYCQDIFRKHHMEVALLDNNNKYNQLKSASYTRENDYAFHIILLRDTPQLEGIEGPGVKLFSI